MSCCAKYASNLMYIFPTAKQNNTTTIVMTTNRPFADLSESFWPFVDAMVQDDGASFSSRRPSFSPVNTVADQALRGSCENIVLWSGTVWNGCEERDKFASIILTDPMFHEKTEYYVFESVGEAIAHVYDLYVRAIASVSSCYYSVEVERRAEKLKRLMDVLRCCCSFST